MGYRLARLRDGVVEFHISGPSDVPGLLVIHVGSPSAATGYPALTAAAARRGMRTLIYSRPGYGRSSRTPGRSVADEAARTLDLVDRLGYGEFLVGGWSGGGPAALACAALLPKGRVRACATFASWAPLLEVGDGWHAWYPEANARELDVLATEGRAVLVPDYEVAAREFGRATPAWLSRFPGQTDAENRALFGDAGLGVPLARSIRRALLNGIWGWFDDDVALATDWGFRVAEIEVPVVVRHGEDDRLVDVRHGRWLAATIPDAHARIVPDRGHVSILDPFSQIVDELVTAAGGPLVS
ncbi:MAG TPA: alpha/beta hydrolase [Candidatus Limnocylindrales bacterium]|nr:alpha/beta hydrolase [Candidatus Limnocylindrales bacterium]